jgi:hypothetical protein
LIDFLESDGTLTFTVRVVPRSSKTEIVGEHDGALKIKLKSPPVDGAANQELVDFLSKLFRLPKSDIEIIHGRNSHSKRIRISGLSSEQMRSVLQAKI